MKARKKYTKSAPQKDARFLKAIAEGSSIGAACALVGYTRDGVAKRKKRDDKFRLAWADFDELAIERMETEADRRAIDGTERPVFYQGEECGRIREFSDTLLIFRLKAKRPSVYRERFEHSGPNDGPIPVAEVRQSIASKLARLAARGNATDVPEKSDE